MSLVDGHGSLFYMFLTMISFSFQKWGAKNLGHNDHNKKCEGHSTAKVCFRQEFPLVNSYETLGKDAPCSNLALIVLPFVIVIAITISRQTNVQKQTHRDAHIDK